MKGKTLKLTVIFSIGMFIIFTLTMALAMLFILLLFRIGVIAQPHKTEIIVIPFTISIVVIGTIIGHFASKRTIVPIIEISEATKEVAKGNFDIKLKGKSHAREVNVMAQNFMLMVQELKNTETFHNDFIHNVSHEFKTPLSAIEGYATLLQNKSLNDEKRERYVEKILYNTKRLSALTGNILQFTRLENQEITTEKKWFSLDEQIREDILLFEEQWSKKQIEMDVDLESVEYFGNSDLLSQAWQNLIGNAVKFVSDGGSIRIILKKDDREAKAYISDNGIGMSEEVIKHVFDKFYQGDISHSTEGNGLGLTLAKRIVDLHGGTIEILSKEGKGTTFIVSLPNQE